jgi:hypothetical protein
VTRPERGFFAKTLAIRLSLSHSLSLSATTFLPLVHGPFSALYDYYYWAAVNAFFFFLSFFLSFILSPPPHPEWTPVAGSKRLRVKRSPEGLRCGHLTQLGRFSALSGQIYMNAHFEIRMAFSYCMLEALRLRCFLPSLACNFSLFPHPNSLLHAFLKPLDSIILSNI